ncbi:MAG TPA: response regulator [Candidatus Saccharimonadales bacterium]|nr:response regulator [Candidatus Saccharimonadales bacterium]
MTDAPSHHLVLYVEDEENDRFLVDYAFKRASPKLVLITAKDGEEAIQWLMARSGPRSEESSQICCVLLDLNLPRKNGFEVLAWIRQQPCYKALPVIVFTSSDHPTDRERALSLGATRFEVKTGHYQDYERLAQSLESPDEPQ